MRLLVSIITITCFTTLFGQTGQLLLHGRTVEGKKRIPTVSIEVIKDNEIILETTSLQNGSYKLSLPLGAVYNIAFQKPGYATKQLGVITTHPKEDISGNYFFQLDLDLIKADSTVIEKTILPPVAKLYIKEKESGFTYDKDYVKWVAELYEEINQ